MKSGKILRIFKKGAKTASAAGKKGSGESKWPSGVRIGVYGHANSGKTVYFTVLNEDCKVSKRLQIAISDTSTSGRLLANYRSIWGVGATSDVGTVVDLRGEKKFPDPTRGDHLLLMNAIVDRSSKIPVVALDYEGKAVSISEQSDLREKVADFMAGCDGILIFYDPKMLGAELQTQEHVASFSSVLEQLAPLGKRLPIPVGLVVTKADILPGFSGDNETILVSPEDENFLSNDFESFLEKVLISNKVASNHAWAGTVRDVLVKLKEFIKIVVGRTLDFQIFFVSCAGVTPEKIGTDVGRSIYAPPEKMQPIGVKEPFYWLLQSVLKNRGIRRMRWLTKWVTILSLAWMLLYSVPYLYHFSFLLPRVIDQEEAILESHRQSGGTLASLSQNQISRILRPYRAYERKWVINWLFTPFRQAAEQMRFGYGKVEKLDIEKVLETYIMGFLDIAADSSLWPIRKVDSAAFADNDNAVRFARLVLDVDSLAVGGSNPGLSRRKERARWFIGKFRDAILVADSSAEFWNQMNEQIVRNQSREDIKLTSAEKSLYSVLQKHEEKQVRVETAKKTGSDIETFLQTVNDSSDPKFRLETVPKRLREVLPTLQGDPANSTLIAQINKYLDGVKRFKTRSKYVYRLASCPDGYHVHVMVRRGKKDTEWRVTKQLFPGVQVDTISWRVGDQIVIALDSRHDRSNPESWGEHSTSKQVLKGNYALFVIEQPLEVGGKTVTFSLDDDLREMLPRIE